MTAPTLSIVSRLGYLALAPFVAGAAVVCTASGGLRTLATQVLVAYGAVVVSFLGGIHWGLGFRSPQPPSSLFIWGVVPSLFAWAALLATRPAALLMHAVMLSLCYAVDRRVYPHHDSARWLPLRLRLSVIAASSCALAAVATWLWG